MENLNLRDMARVSTVATIKTEWVLTTAKEASHEGDVMCSYCKATETGLIWQLTFTHVESGLVTKNNIFLCEDCYAE